MSLSTAEKLILFSERPFSLQDFFLRNPVDGFIYEGQDVSLAANYVAGGRSDLIVQWAESTGVTPITVTETACGLRLDERYTGIRGAELVSPLDFTSGWSNTGTAAPITASGFTVSGTGGLYRSMLTVGATYEVIVNVTVSGSIFGLINSTGASVPAVLNGSTTNGTGTYQGIFTAANAGLYFRLAGAGSITVNSITVKAVPGNHASQSTAAARPTLSARINLLLATDTLATQSVTVIAAPHVLSFTGTGTVTLSGVSTAGPLVGTGASNRVELAFTPTAGSLTLTVAGSVTFAQLELGT